MKEIAKATGRNAYRGGTLALLSFVAWMLSDFREEMRREMNAHHCNCVVQKRAAVMPVPMPEFVPLPEGFSPLVQNCYE